VYFSKKKRKSTELINKSANLVLRLDNDKNNKVASV
jgi:hypothetical protein